MFNVDIFSDWNNDLDYTGSAEEFTENSTITDDECQPCPNGTVNNSTNVDSTRHETYASEAGKICLIVFLTLLSLACVSFLCYKLSQSTVCQSFTLIHFSLFKSF